ncbi:hypothetical protein, partial [Paraburkholderia aspalathi]|uniref:hypothetical protein n=1 Tax=Paraburkholderia aspalathi TaxID=1324617 RepID=UPI001ABFD5DB
TFLNIPLSGCPGLLDHYSAAPHRGNANRPLTKQGTKARTRKGQSPKNTANAAAKGKKAKNQNH